MNSVNKAVIFDLDGTLIDSMRAFRTLVITNLGKRGIELSEARMKEIGLRLLESSQRGEEKGGIRLIFNIFWKIGRIFGLNRINSLLFTVNCISEMRSVYRNSQLFPDTIESLSILSENGFCLGICTSATSKQLTQTLRKYNLDRFFVQDALVSRNDVRIVKPDPEGLLLVLKQCSANPKRSFFVGDLPIDIHAGNSAGVATIGLTTGIITKALFHEYSNPLAVFDSLKQATEWILNVEGSTFMNK
ncbi:MAG: HAD family hydrolase [Candidatus Hodarchaeales archaeon]|jgi:phosphoglycolate phosphatase-like HAD superfamily hydrolase